MPDLTEYSAYDAELLPPVVVSYLDKQTDPSGGRLIVELLIAP